MVDIHSHILSGLDDGPETLEESVAMVRMAADAGTTDIVASPHANSQFTFRPELIDEKIRELLTACENRIRIHRGCDFHLSYDNIQDSLENPAKYAINNKRYLLVEFSDLLILKITDEVFYRMQSAGLIPIITHPERNMLLQRRLEEMQKWVNSGCLIQVTAQSLLGRFGKQAKSFSDELLKRNMVHFIASDAHDSQDRTPVLDTAYDYVEKNYGERRAENLLVGNPGAAIAGTPIDMYEQIPVEPKRWYEFWK